MCRPNVFIIMPLSSITRVYGRTSGLKYARTDIEGGKNRFCLLVSLILSYWSLRMSDDSYKRTIKTFNWASDGDKCYVKIKVSGRRSVFKAESYSANKKNLFGYSTDITRPTLDDPEASATCLEYKCSEILSNGSFSENTYIVITPILGDCKFFNTANDFDLYQNQCPYSLPPQQGENRSICDVPKLLPFLLDVPGLYNSLYYPRGTAESSCRTGDPRLGFIFSGMFSRGYALHYNCT